ncbi:MAG: copper transporter [Coriobacteriales bacterium]|nr:copper transporter [Actinomycetes bacterium]
MYNLRYHIASLVAVFLALTIGLVLGSVVAERGTIGDQTSIIVQDLQKQFDAMQQENRALREQLQHDRAFAQEAVPVLTAEALRGKTVGVLVNSGRSSGLEAVTTSIEQAGGTPVVFTFEKPMLGLDIATPEGLSGMLGQDVGGTPDAILEAVASRMAGEWLRQGERPVTDLLVDDGELSVDGATATATVDACVVMASFSGEPDSAAMAIAKAFDGSGVVVTGVEATNQATGVAAEAVDAGFSAVDHVDTPAGAFSLVWVLSGRATGYYGLGTGSDGAYPPLEAKPARS